MRMRSTRHLARQCASPTRERQTHHPSRRTHPVNDNARTTTTTSRTSSSSDPQRQKLRAMMNRRMDRAIEALRLVGKVSHTALAKDAMTEADADRALARLDQEMQVTAKRLRSGVTGRQTDIEYDMGG